MRKKSLATLLLGVSMLSTTLGFAQEKKDVKAKYDVSAGWFSVGEIEGDKKSFVYDLGELGQLEFSRNGDKYSEFASGKKGKVWCDYTIEGDSIKLDKFYSDRGEWSRDPSIQARKETQGRKMSLDYSLGIDWFRVFEENGPIEEFKIMFFSEPHIAYRSSDIIKKRNGSIEALYMFDGNKINLPDKKDLHGPMKVVMKKKPDGSYEVLNLTLRVDSNTILGNINLKMDKAD